MGKRVQILEVSTGIVGRLARFDIRNVALVQKKNKNNLLETKFYPKMKIGEKGKGRAGRYIS